MNTHDSTSQDSEVNRYIYACFVSKDSCMIEQSHCVGDIASLAQQ